VTARWGYRIRLPGAAPSTRTWIDYDVVCWRAQSVADEFRCAVKVIGPDGQIRCTKVPDDDDLPQR
jgi:hypothetical protein